MQNRLYTGEINDMRKNFWEHYGFACLAVEAVVSWNTALTIQLFLSQR